MFIQGNLQIVFDVLYQMGVIDPVLKLDWQEEFHRLESNPNLLSPIIEVVNSCQNDTELLLHRLHKCDEKTLHYLAMEVAREFADFYARTELH